MSRSTSPDLLSASRPDLPWTDPSSSAGLRAIVTNGDGTAAVSYRLGLREVFTIQTLSVDVDTSGAGAPTKVKAELFSQSGALLAAVQSVAEIDPGIVGEITFAPQLDDTATLPAPVSGAVIQTGLWATEATAQCTVTVTVTEPGAVVLQARMWVQGTTGAPGDVKPFPYRLAHVPL